MVLSYFFVRNSLHNRGILINVELRFMALTTNHWI